MAEKIVLADTSILIEFFRKKNKANTVLLQLLNIYDGFVISAITEYEIYTGINSSQKEYWEAFLAKTKVLPFDSLAAQKACEIEFLLKQKSKQIDKADLFIAAVAIANKLPLATLNHKHFSRIESLEVI